MQQDPPSGFSIRALAARAHGASRRPLLRALLVPSLVLSVGCVSDPGATGGDAGNSGTTGNTGSGAGQQTGSPGTGGGKASGTGGSKASGSGGAKGTGSTTGSGSGSTSGSGSGSSTGSGSGSSTGTTGSGGSPGTGSGSGGNSGSGGDSALPAPPSALPLENACKTNSPGPRMLRRLSASEFSATINDLFGDNTAVPTATVFQDPTVLGFGVDAGSLLVQDLNADQLESNAEAIAAWATSTSSVLSKITPCQTTDDACQTKFIQQFGKLAFRSPLSTDRVTAYKKIFALGTSFTDSASAVISAMLQSPYFLYKSELGTSQSGKFPLTPYEVATSLSYLLTGSMPDAQLMTAADSWSTPPTQAQIDTQLNRLISGPAAQTALMNFMSGWLGLNRLYTNAKDNTVYMLTDTQRADMMSETTNLIVDTFNNGGTVGDLFSADHSFLNQELAQFYGISTNGLSASQFTKVSYPMGGPRDRGILAHASILNGYSRPDISSPTQRGHLVRSRILCQDVPPPPPNLNTKLSDPTTDTPTTRAQYEQHVHPSDPSSPCPACHTLMDPIGFGFEAYDGFGRHRTTQNGQPIDPSNVIHQAGTTGMDVSNADLTGLGQYLSTSDDVKACSARYWAYFAYGDASWDEDGCTYDSIRTAAKAGNYSMKSVLTAIVHAPHFTTRVQDK